MPRLMLLSALLFSSLPLYAADELIRPDAEILFERDVRPLLKAACFHCHGEEEELSGSLDLRLRRFLVQGGDSGAAIVPGKPGESVLIQRVRDHEMPPQEAGKPLTDDELELLTKWISLGAPTRGTEPGEIPRGLIISEEDRKYWAFQPVVRHDVPAVDANERVTTPVDAFVLSRLEAKGLSLSPRADRRTLIRRAYFDLLGLPPAPDDVEAFVADTRPDAWERLIDDLLERPQFGERWASHWLDVAGYADSEGVTNTDPERKWAWKYRDYVIRSLNENKPFDRFVIEQLAGDELVPPPYKDLSPEQIEWLTATGFLRMAPDGTMSNEVEAPVARNQVIADTMEIVGSSLLGMTVNCAQCHEHRYDPIPQADYYRLRAVFEPALDWKNWKTPAQRQLSLYTDEMRRQASEMEKEAAAVLAERDQQQAAFIEEVFQKEIAKVPDDEREQVTIARNTPDKERTPEQKKLLQKHPSVNVSAGSLYLYNQKAADDLKALADKAQEIRAQKPQEEFLRIASETPGKVPATFVFARGDHQQPQEEVAPASLSILESVSTVAIPADDPELPTTGRRLAFARSLTEGKHPLLTRVTVNRIWMHLLGRGIVRTPGDFGRLGTPPTHPELLDWLADEFVREGWDQKTLIKLVMRSQVYQQSSRGDAALLEADPDNDLFGRANLKRLEAEVVRDAVLSVSGTINPKPFGPPVPVMADLVGQWVIGIENLNAGRPGAVIDMKGEDLRRSIYVQVRRSRPLAVLETFDRPRMEPNCDRRDATTVAPQSLLMLNGQFVLEQSMVFAESLLAASDARAEQIRGAWLRTYSRLPDDSELADAEQFLVDQTAELAPRAEKKESPEKLALANLCQILLGSNEFLYVD